MKRAIILAITGASGSIYVPEFLKIMARLKIEVDAVISDSGKQVMQFELGVPHEKMEHVRHWYDQDDFTAPMASGSAPYDGMAVLPCTMGTLAAIANGISGNLIHRAADVALKEKRRLVLAVRESPLNRVHLQNMLSANDAGAIICPPMPAFYHTPRPETVQEIAEDFAARVATLLGFEVPGMRRWDGVAS